MVNYLRNCDACPELFEHICSKRKNNNCEKCECVGCYANAYTLCRHCLLQKHYLITRQKNGIINMDKFIKRLIIHNL